jgi:hypothetical protein
MTSMVTRDELEDELYKLVGQHRAAQLPRLMRIIDSYAISVSRKMGPIDWHPDPYKYLKPGETSAEGDKRRCRQCGKVKDLTIDNFAPAARDPYNRRQSCTDCSPNGRRHTEFFCRGCGERHTIDKFPPAKKKNPRLQIHCLFCEPK